MISVCRRKAGLTESLANRNYGLSALNLFARNAYGGLV